MIEERRLIKRIKVPEGVEITIEGNLFKAKGASGETERRFNDPMIMIEKDNDKIVIKPKKFTKKQKCLVNTTKAHVLNLIKGVKDGFVYKLKICSGHFPMNVSLEGNKLVIKNFFGEKVPRVAKILDNVKVEVKGDLVTVSGSNIEAVGQTATNIEQSTRITNRDRRVFQDGIWIIEKAGKKVAR